MATLSLICKNLAEIVPPKKRYKSLHCLLRFQVSLISVIKNGVVSFAQISHFLNFAPSVGEFKLNIECNHATLSGHR